MAGKILIADADPVQRRLLDEIVSGFGYQTVHASEGQEIISLVGKTDTTIKLIILDLQLPDLDGFEILKGIQKTNSNCPVIIQTAIGGIETVVKAMRAGASDFFVKPISATRLRPAIKSALTQTPISTPSPPQPLDKSMAFGELVYCSPKMKHVVQLAKLAASSNIPVIIEGETGVGKELIAKAIQCSGARSTEKFITVNCGALPENLIESVLFGHEKGSFTGATNSHLGKFVEADGGTLFLDEVGELAGATQIKLLRALQEGEVDPIGSKQPTKTDFRLISATNLNLEIESQNGNFREDLFYRLNVFPIVIPPLRERREEIPALARHFLAKYSKSENRPDIKTFDEKTLDLLTNFDWPGNIRQLENSVFRAVVLCNANKLLVSHFPQISKTAPKAFKGEIITIEETPSISIDQQESTKLVTNEGQIKELEEIESEVILFALELYDGKLSEVAKRLGIGRSTLYRRLKELGIGSDPQDAAKIA